MSLIDLAAIVAGYLIGSIPFGLLVAKYCGGINIRDFGSGNIGATNVGRAMGFRWFIVVFVLDCLKGLLPTLGAQLIAKSGQLGDINPHSIVATGLAAVIGHMYPCFLGFKGGKGVATGLGVVIVLAPLGSLVAATTFGLTFAIWRTVSLSSILGAILFATVQMFLIKPHPFAGETWSLGLFSLLVPAMIVVRHRSNILRLIRGEEHAFRKRDETPAE